MVVPTGQRAPASEDHWQTTRRLVFPLVLPRNTVVRRAKVVFGGLVLATNRALIERFERGAPPRNRLERAALAALVVRRRQSGDLDRLATLHRSFWASPAAAVFHRQTEHRFETAFRQRHYTIVGALEKAVQDTGIRNLCEIGCGSGQVLEHLAARLPNLRRLVGLDLSSVQIAINRARNGVARLSFECGDALEWADSQASGGWAWFCYGGVLEFFPQARLAALFKACAAHPPTLFALVEPLADDFDVDVETRSRHFGIELTSSHPYPRMLRDAGFSDVWRQETHALGYRWLMLVMRRE